MYLRIHWLQTMSIIWDFTDFDGRRLLGKIRYGHAGAMCTVENIGEGRIRCHFEEPVRAVTPGQAVVFYDGEFVAGGGIIIGK